MRLLGDIFSNPDSFDPEKSESFYREAMVLANELGMRPLLAHCHHGLARLYRQIGRKDQSQEHLAMATNMFREMEMNFWLEKAEKEKLQLS